MGKQRAHRAAANRQGKETVVVEQNQGQSAPENWEQKEGEPKEVYYGRLFEIPEKPSYAHRGDWQEMAEFYVELSPHVPLAEAMKEGMTYDLPMFFIPGTMVRWTAMASEGQELMIKFRRSYRTPGELPTTWVPLSKTPPFFQRALKQQEVFAIELGGDLSPYTSGLATALIAGKLDKPLRMAFRILQRPDGTRFPLGVTYVPVEGNKVKREKVFDPYHMSGLEEGEVLPIRWFSQSQPEPDIHLLRTWARLESYCKTALGKKNHFAPAAPTKP